MTATVFYSWQSDLGEREHKRLQRNALDGACQSVEREMNIPLAVEDFGDERAGSPDFAEKLVEQIGRSTIVVADLTLTGTRPSRDGHARLSPNPNVAKEVGIARALLGSNSLILIMNEHYGFVGLVPPDFASYVPCLYTLSPSSSDAVVHGQESELATTLAEEIACSLRKRFFEGFSPSVRPAVASVVSFLLGPESTRDAKVFREFEISELAAAAGLSEGEAREACDALRGSVDRSGGSAGNLDAPVSATRHLCLQFDVLVNRWNPQLDAEKVAAVLARDRTGQRISDLAPQLAMAPRQMNVALEQLQRWSVIGSSGNVDAGSPFIVPEIWPIAAIDEVARGALRHRSRRG